MHLAEISAERRAAALTPFCSSTGPAGIDADARSLPKQHHARLPCPRDAPELNPVENIWQYLRQNWLSNRVFDTYEAIVEAACEAWRKLLAQPATITSIGLRDWAHRSDMKPVGIIWWVPATFMGRMSDLPNICHLISKSSEPLKASLGSPSAARE